MSTQAEPDRTSVQEFSQRFRREMIPLNNSVSYFAALPLGEEEVREYLEEPMAALPPAVGGAFGKISVFLVPYLEKAAGKRGDMVTFERPDERHQIWSSQFLADIGAVFVFGVKDRPVADYHYVFYRAVAILLADHVHNELMDQYPELLREELRGRVHGEIDEEGWQFKQSLLQRQSDAHRDTKLFRNYVRQSLIDTLTLYLHGICCDIDVEPGPRQIPSRYLRKRLQLLQEAFPPPTGFAVFPEDVSKT